MAVAKTNFVSELAFLTGADLPFVRQRIRSPFQAGYGPRRAEPLTYNDIAAYLIGFMASPTHLEAADIIRRYAEFLCVGASGDTQSVASISQRFLTLPEPSLLAVLTAVIEARAKQDPVNLLSLVAVWPPYPAFCIRLLSGAGAPPVDLTFGPAVAAIVQLKDFTAWPLRHEVTLSGHVVDRLAPLGEFDVSANLRTSEE